RPGPPPTTPVCWPSSSRPPDPRRARRGWGADSSRTNDRHPRRIAVCRNITILRGLQPPATPEEIEAAARQYVRKVSGATKPPAGAEAVFEQAIAAVAAATTTLLG